jgi:type VI secretion system protein ImpL
VTGAIREASNRELQSTDWVLKTAAKDDLTLEGSPEQIQKALIDLYKADYAKEWAKFMQGVTIADLNGFEASVQAMNRLGDPQASPLAKVLKTVYDETSWDDPSQARVNQAKLKRGLLGWFREVVLRQAPSQARQIADAAAPMPGGIRRHRPPGRHQGKGCLADDRLPGRVVEAALAPEPAEEPGRPGPRRQAADAADPGGQRL